MTESARSTATWNWKSPQCTHLPSNIHKVCSVKMSQSESRRFRTEQKEKKLLTVCLSAFGIWAFLLFVDKSRHRRMKQIPIPLGPICTPQLITTMPTHKCGRCFLLDRLKKNRNTDFKLFTRTNLQLLEKEIADGQNCEWHYRTLKKVKDVLLFIVFLLIKSLSVHLHALCL